MFLVSQIKKLVSQLLLLHEVPTGCTSVGQNQRMVSIYRVVDPLTVAAERRLSFEQNLDTSYSLFSTFL